MSRLITVRTAVLVSMLAALPVLHLRAEEPGDGAREVTIRSRETGEPIPGARIWLYAEEESWLPPGWRWVFQGEPYISSEDGSVDLLPRPGRESLGRVAIVANGYRGVATFLYPRQDRVFLPPPDSVMGVVFDGKTQRPLSAVTVRTYIPLDGMCDICGHDHVTGLGPIRDAAETDGAGRFRLEDGGDFRLLSVECEGYATLWKGVTLDEDVTAVKVMLPRAAELTGVVREASGHLIPGVAVVAHPACTKRLLNPSRVWIEGSTPHMWKDSPLWKAAHTSTSTTDETGRFVLDTLVPGTAYWIWSKHGDSFGMIEASTGSHGWKKETVDLVLAPLSSLNVSVETASGEPAGEVSLVIYRRQRVPPYSRWGSTDASGEITFGSMPPGRYVVSAECDGPAVEAVVELPGDAEKVVLRLK